MKKIEQTKAHDGPVAVRAGTIIGLLAGIALGFVEGPKGAAIGAFLGGLMGFVAGGVQAREADRASARERQLDADIGITKGSLGAYAIHKRPSVVDEREAWGSDWLTPPPPRVG